MVKKVLVSTFRIRPELKQRLEAAGLTVRERTTGALSSRDKALQSAWGLFTLLTHRVDAELLALAPNLKVVGNLAVGFNNIDLKECSRRKVKVLNTPDVLTRATAELTIALLFAVARRFAEGEQLVRSGNFKGWAPDMLLGHELKGRRATIVGHGRIGRETGLLMKALGLRVEFITRSHTKSAIDRILRQTQILSLHLRYSQENHHWLSAKRIAMLPSDAIVLNTGRGALIDEQALVRALERRKIFGAGLDVYEFEPKVPHRLLRLKNTALLPHLGSATEQARFAMAELLVDGVIKILNGKAPSNQVRDKE